MVHRRWAASGDTSEIEPTMPDGLSLTLNRTLRGPRDRSQDRKSRQYSDDSVKSSAVPMTSR